MSKADALQHYFRKVGDSFEAQQAAAEVCIRAKRRAGELIGRNGEEEKSKGCR